MRLVHTVRGFVRLGLRDQVRFTAAWSLLGFYRVLIAVLPFTVIRRLLGDDASGGTTAAAATGATLSPTEQVRAAHIGRIVEAAAAHAPLRADCYPQALTARTFLALRRIPHTVTFGVRRDGDALLAHAWVRAGDVVVTGGDSSTYTPVGAFTWMPRAGRAPVTPG